MSFILDALKKSELERQRQTVPGLMDTRLSPKRNRLPLWAAALGVLLGINLLGLTYVLLRKSTPAAQAPRSADAARAAASGAAPAETRHFSPLDSAPEYAPEIPVAPPAGAASADPQRARAAAAAAAEHAAPHPDPLLTDANTNANTNANANANADAEAGAAAEEVLPSISEVSLSGAQALPDLHLDVHVYATQPAERFVYINNRKYHEGARLQEGPTIERIRRDGVVLNYQGVRFLLPRQP
jgi:general secretion pathway protein B